MSKVNRPKFITFEGGEGSGKSTQSRLFYEYLLSIGMKAIHTREVGGTEEAEKIRDLLVHSELFPLSELMLVMAARYEHINKVIIPALDAGSWVICDRFVDSTACYQSGDSGLEIADIYELHDRLMRPAGTKEEALMPDLTFFMDIAPEEGLARAGGRGVVNKFESKAFEFHKRIHSRFKQIAKMHKDRVVSIEVADKNIDKIHEEVKRAVFG